MMNVKDVRMIDFIRFCIIGFVAIVCVSCSTDESNDDEPQTNNDVIEIGDYYLLEESIAELPYLNRTKIVFADSLGVLVVFDIEEEELRQSGEITLYNYNVVEEGDTVKYRYTSETKSFVISNDELGMQFNFSLVATPYQPDPEGAFVADVLNIFCVDPDPNIYSSQVFTHVTDSRTWPTTYTVDLKDELLILGRTFIDVYSNNFSDPKSHVNYNYSYGIVSFTDAEGKLWRFEGLI